jgi:hypothetical protein
MRLKYVFTTILLLALLVKPALASSQPEPIPAYSICGYADNPGLCTACFDSGGVWTALGCIPVDPQAFVINLIQFAFGIGGGIAFLIMLYGIFIIVISAGDPERVIAGQQTITSAIAGLLFIIFAMVILNLLGVQVLQIPGF